MKAAIVLFVLVLVVSVFPQQQNLLSLEECTTNVKLMRAQAAENPEFKNQILQSYFEMSKTAASSTSEEEATEIIDALLDESTADKDACANVLNIIKNHSLKSAKRTFAKECPKMITSIRSSFALIQQYSPQSLEQYLISTAATFTRLGYTAEEALPFFKEKVVNEDLPVDSLCEEIADKYVEHFASEYGVQSDDEDPLLNGPFDEEEDSNAYATWLLPLIRYGDVPAYDDSEIAEDEEERDIKFSASTIATKSKINPALVLNYGHDDAEEDEEEESDRPTNPVLLLNPARKPAKLSKPDSLSDKVVILLKKALSEELCKKKYVYRPEFWLVCKSN